MNIRSFIALFTVTVTFGSGEISGQEKPAVEYLNNRFPLVEKPYIELPLGSIKPKGWLEDQLLSMKDGMTGNLDNLYENVMGPRNGWLGGDGDLWERGPYWIDGLVPLAYILEDRALIEKARKWIDWALNSQKENGYFGPDTDFTPETGLQRRNSADWWPRMVVLKFLQQYYSATQDQRVISFMTSYFLYQLETLPEKPLGNWTYWAEQRGGDNLMVVYWLYNITGDKFLLDLAHLIHKQTTPWSDYLSDRETMTTLFSLHCVNVAQGVKEPVLYYQQTKDQALLQSVKTGFRDMDRAIGWPTGLYGGDEALHTNNPTQGSELCTAVEMMFSLENMLAITGDIEYAERLEKVAFNALPTQATDNYDARQYYQQLNQIEVSFQDRNFEVYYDGTDQLFGLLTGYPCCTSNMHQGWPKFTQNLFYATSDNGVAALIYSPSEATVRVAGNTQVRITEETSYPFEETIRFRFDFGKNKQGAYFPFHLNIPSWCRNGQVRINGEEYSTYEPGQIIKINRRWNTGDIVELYLPMHIRITRWYENSAAVEHGPLLYALRIGEKWEKVANTGQMDPKYGDSYYEVFPESPWNYAILSQNIIDKNLENSFNIIRKEKITGYPWNIENAPVEIKTTGVRVPQWKEYNGSAGPMPYSPQHSLGKGATTETITLIPYGCTTLRIALFPVTDK